MKSESGSGPCHDGNPIGPADAAFVLPAAFAGGGAGGLLDALHGSGGKAAEVSDWSDAPESGNTRVGTTGWPEVLGGSGEVVEEIDLIDGSPCSGEFTNDGGTTAELHGGAASIGAECFPDDLSRAGDLVDVTALANALHRVGKTLFNEALPESASSL